ncbi:hypothetical protein VYU27_009093 [Nannochloropsis oceanica]
MITTATFNAAQHSITAATTTSCSKCVNDPCGAPKDAVALGLRQEECWGEDLKLTYLACRHRARRQSYRPFLQNSRSSTCGGSCRHQSHPLAQDDRQVKELLVQSGMVSSSR